MHDIADEQFHCLQVDVPGPAPFAQSHRQQSVYFLTDLLLDRAGRFFSCSARVSSTGRT